MVKAAYSLAKQFHPDTVPAGASAELARVKARFATIGEKPHPGRCRPRPQATLAEGGPVDVALLQAEETFNKERRWCAPGASPRQ
jgi:hypothetical protein